MGKWYTGITLGPIYDTLQLASSPAGLWGASTLFSWIARRLIEELCKKLKEKGIKADTVSDCFVSPCFSWDDTQGRIVIKGCEDMVARGVGMLHDRIILEGKHSEDFSCVFDVVKTELAENIHSDIKKAYPEKDTLDERDYIREWLNEYLRIYAVEVEVPDDTSPILHLGDRLGAIELEGNFVFKESYNPILALFENAFPGNRTRENKNEIIKKSFLLPDGKNWMLLKGDKVRDIENIAFAGWESAGEWKSGKYYAILQSDGDSMGKTLGRLKEKIGIQAFSKKCLSFCAEASRIMLHYGGMPIYAGGDDLLAILPVTGFISDLKDESSKPASSAEPNEEKRIEEKGREEQKKPKNGTEISIFRLLNMIREKFNDCFVEEQNTIKDKNKADPNNEEEMPTISFGVTIQYIRSPLYEAIEDSGSLLWEVKQGIKNSLTMVIHKHSGTPLRISLEQLETNEIDGKNVLLYLDELVMQARKRYGEENGEGNFYRNAGYQLEKHNALLRHAVESCNEVLIDNLFINLFDNINQEKYQQDLEQLRELCKQIIRKMIPVIQDTPPKNENEEDRKKRENSIENTVCRIRDMLRVLRFMTERGGEAE